MRVPSFFPATLVAVLTVSCAAAQTSYTLQSPDNQIQVVIRPAAAIQYDVVVNGKPVLRNSTLSLTVDGTTLGRNVRVKGTTKISHDEILHPAIHRKFADIRDHYNQLRIETEDNLAVTFRAYDNGVAYRLETSLPKSDIKVNSEQAAFNFADNYTVYYPLEDSFFSHNERAYAPHKLSELTSQSLASLPAVVDAGGVKIALANADVENYPGMWLRGAAGNAVTADFPPYPLKETLSRDRDLRPTQTADYIAATTGTRTYPWRILGIARNDGDLITSQIVWLLEKPSQLQDTSWIKPGKVAWDWWNFNNIYGVDFKAGINTQTYKYYIDFAAKYGLSYIILDEGWYKLGNVLDVVPDINVQELVNYGKQKNVGIILWVVWNTLDSQLQPALDQFAKWGIQGIKVDFMQRDDQKVMDYYYKLAREAASRHMLLDFHGSQIPASLTRTWPNIITTEGVRGMEHSKWSADDDALHNVTLPFTRMFLGPMDFTPGAMLNANKATFAQINDRPMALGTRCQQLAMYVVYVSPLQMLADSPSNYMREPEAMEFLSKVPTTWDETRVLDAKLAEYVVVARRNGDDWYIGAMTNWTPRDLTLDLSFLPQGNLQIDYYQDGINADRMAADYKLVKTRLNRTAPMKIHLAPGGGWAARIHR